MDIKEVSIIARNKGYKGAVQYLVSPESLSSLFVLASIQKWLRDTQKIDISINPHYMVNGGVAGYLFDVSSSENSRSSSLNKKETHGDESAYEPALLSGVNAALQLI